MAFAVRLLASGFGVGFVPKLPGTLGSLLGLFFFVPLSRLSTPVLVLTVAAFVCLSVWVADSAVRLADNKDPPWVVIDEIAGMWVTLLFWEPTLLNLVLGFALFRFFDIVKWGPIRSLEKRPGGWGVVLDDVGAGVLANLSLWGIHWWMK